MKKILFFVVIAFVMTVRGIFHGVECCHKKDSHVPWILFFLNVSFWVFFWLRTTNKISVSTTAFIVIGSILFTVSLVSLYLMNNLPGYHGEEACSFFMFDYGVGIISTVLVFSQWMFHDEYWIFKPASLQPEFAHYLGQIIFLILAMTFTVKAFIFWRHWKRYA